MHALDYYLILLVSLSLFILVLNLTIVEATNLISSVSFKANLISRNTTLSPNHDSSMSHGSISHGHNIRLSSKYFSQSHINTTTNVAPNGGAYLIVIFIGNPPIKFTTLVDTGSDLMWVQCSPCSSCFAQDSPLFEPIKSSTYHTISCNSPSCGHYPYINTTCAPNQITNNKSCAYSAFYGSGGLRSKGVLSTDTISFRVSNNASQPSFPSLFILGCGYDQKGQLGTFGHGDGLVGLGRGPLSLVSQLGPKINHKFSYCLTPLSSHVAGKIQFGGLDVAHPGAVSTPFKTYSPIFYTLSLNAISIGNNLIPASLDIIIDSGTTYTFVPTIICDSVRATMMNAIGLGPVPGPNKILNTCYEIQPYSDGFNPPDVVFHFKGADVVLKVVNTFRDLGNNFSCLAIVPTDDDHVIFGNIAQINFEVGYDLNLNKVSFTPADCTKY